jgi:thiamine biosynthesis lipoprotein
MMKKNQGALRRTQDKMPDPFDSTRREFLTGRTLQKEVERTGSAMTEELLKELSREAPVGGNTVRLTTEAMACEFSVVMNQGASRHLMTAAAVPKRRADSGASGNRGSPVPHRNAAHPIR